MKFKKFSMFTLIAAFAVLAFSTAAMAQVTVTPSNAAAEGWVPFTRAGGTISWVVDPTAPGGEALRLTTANDGNSKALFIDRTVIPFSEVTELSYWTKQVSAPFPGANASYQLQVCLGGFNSPQTPTNPTGCTGFTTLVFEPYQHNGLNPSTQAVIPGQWQQWDVDAGMFWSSGTYSNGACSVQAGFGGTYFYNLSDLQAACPGAMTVGYGVNIGGGNPGWDVYTDLVSFNGVVTDFELYANDKEQCKNGGWQVFMRPPSNTPFKNQGDCIQFMNTGK